MYNPLPIFRFIAEKQAQAKGVSLVTMTDVQGTSMRRAGTHMAVCDDGSYAGFFTGGCIEAAVVADALQIFGEAKPRQIRFGAGSPYVDIRLPCGGSVEIDFREIADPTLGSRACDLFERRVPFSLALVDDGALILSPSEHDRFGIFVASGRTTVCHIPSMRIVMIGSTAAMPVLAELARACQTEIVAVTPDEALLSTLRLAEIQATALTKLSDRPEWPQDRWTALAFLFHDHEWETGLLASALSRPALYIGAMGSVQAHRARCAALAQLGVGATALAQIVSPIGVIHSTRDPETLAVSVFAQIMQSYDRACLIST